MNMPDIPRPDLADLDKVDDPEFRESLEIPFGLVPLDDLLDPIREEMIYGDSLENGMIVLSESVLLRGDPEEAGPDAHPLRRVRALETSRWCRVTQLRRLHDLIQFIGVYSDGTKMERMYNHTCVWRVLKESM